MRRAAVVLASRLSRPLLRRVIRSRNGVLLTSSSTSSHATSNDALGIRSLSSRRERVGASVLQSSMHIRTFSVALVSAGVLSGAWYYRQGLSSSDTQTADASTSASPTASVGTASAGARGAQAQQSPSTRKALVVEKGNLFTGTITGNEPLSKDTDDYGRKVLEMMTPEQVTQKLRKNEESYLVGRGAGVVRYDVVQIPSNDPIEDDHAEKIIEVPGMGEAGKNSDWMFWGVFDGHSGWTTSAKLRQTLISFVARELNTTYTNATANTPSPSSIDQAIKQGFLRLDHEIVLASVDKVLHQKSKRYAAELLAPALSGSCALLSFYDSRSKELKVACTGDSRAVLGRRGGSGKWIATPLSIDQTGGNEEEAARMRREHPGEPDVVRNGRVLGGLEPSRAFGDASYKWPLEIQDKLKKGFFGRTPSKLLRTPPYVTAEPVITTTKVQPENGDFVVMATDGLWEMLTNEEVVGLVGQWLETQAKSSSLTSHTHSNGKNGGDASWLTSWFSSQSKGLPVENANKKDTAMGGQRAPIRQQQWGIEGAGERFVVADKNAATHLVRNALGGKDEDQLCALLTLPSPYSRRYRDDLTVEVIFFGEGPSNGNVTLNREASAGSDASADVKSKL
ncbi:protein serine/threonine phosphatase 2C [Tothia fuscella]|uniref:Protein serine/threonine phosphatase 2C n=1 Tax=Tothia fuscella TaxID=1048955 RepID=A0A9P4TS97_9PEZI|nr:protein serine/threonine phosphatase 2C [Tothia fuscella]